MPHRLQENFASIFIKSPGIDPEGVAWGVFKVLEKHMPAGGIGNLKAILPAEIRSLRPEREGCHTSESIGIEVLERS